MIHCIKTYSIRYKVKKVYERKILHSFFYRCKKNLAPIEKTRKKKKRVVNIDHSFLMYDCINICHKKRVVEVNK